MLLSRFARLMKAAGARGIGAGAGRVSRTGSTLRCRVKKEPQKHNNGAIRPGVMSDWLAP